MRLTIVRWVRRGLLTAAVAVLAAAALPGFAETATGIGISITPAGITYLTRPGDTLSHIAAQLTSASGNWQQIGKLNGISQDTRIAVGTPIRIPTALLADQPSTAAVVTMVGTVHALGPDNKVMLLKEGSRLPEGVELQTAANSFVTLSLPDASRLSIPSNSRVKLSKLRMARFTNSPRTEMTVLRGSVDSSVSPLDQNMGRFEVKTRFATAGVRGTRFRVGILPDGTTATELVSGTVEIQRNGSAQSVLLHAGEGNLVNAAGLGNNVALLEAPVLLEPSVSQADTKTIFNLAVLPGAMKYHLLLATDAAGELPIAETRSTDVHPTLKGIRAGHYFARISAIDAHGLEGHARMAPVTVSAASPAANAIDTVSAPRVDSSNHRQFRLRWQAPAGSRFNVQVARDANFSWLQFNATADKPELTLPRPPFGTYYARVRVQRADGSAGPYSATQSFIVTDQWIIHDGDPMVAHAEPAH